jgi:translation elongation factor EF-G
MQGDLEKMGMGLNKLAQEDPHAVTLLKVLNVNYVLLV